MYSGMMSTAKALADPRGRGELARLGQRTDVLQAIIATDGPRAFAHELHAVVVRRVVARRDHDAAIHLLEERREVHDLGAAQADVVDVDAGVEQALLERLAEQLARKPDVAANDDFARLHELCICAADAIRDVFVQLFGDASAEVVRFESIDRDGMHGCAVLKIEIPFTSSCLRGRRYPRSGRYRPRRGNCPIALR
jgi:hypothetical protein